jgi:hypothetical protein
VLQNQRSQSMLVSRPVTKCDISAHIVGHEPVGASGSLLCPTGLNPSVVLVFLVFDLSQSPRLEAREDSLIGFLRTAFSLVVITVRSVRFSVMFFCSRGSLCF